MQGVEHEHTRLVLGNRTEQALRFKDYAAYYRGVKRRFEATVFGGSCAAPRP